jgi:hypothetical protein
MVGVRPWAIFLGGVVLAAIFQLVVTSTFGDSAAMLQVGQKSYARPFIEAELGDDIPTFPDFGHDGQLSYIVARRPFGGEGIDVLESAAFRYRRWLYPALAGGFGTFSPRGTVLGLAVWAAIGFGLAAAALVVIGETYGVRSRLLALGVYLNIGLILSTMIVTSDALGMGLALTGVAAYRKDHRLLAVGLLAAASLTKEQFLVFSIAVAIDAWMAGDRKSAVGFLLLPLGVIAGASVLAVRAFGGSGGLNSNITAPLAGILDASDGWASAYVTLRRGTYLTLIGLVLVGPLAVWTRERLIILLSVGWMAGALLAAELVWREGTDSLRVFASFWPLIALSIAIGFGRSHRRRQSSSIAVD